MFEKTSLATKITHFSVKSVFSEPLSVVLIYSRSALISVLFISATQFQYKFIPTLMMTV